MVSVGFGFTGSGSEAGAGTVEGADGLVLICVLGTGFGLGFTGSDNSELNSSPTLRVRRELS